MGLFLANEVGRTAWFILYSSMLYTFEVLIKFRKERAFDGMRLCNIFYVDLPSRSSAVSEDSWA